MVTKDNPGIVYISCISWDFLWQRQQQLATEFAKSGSQVLFVEPSFSLFSLIKTPKRIKSIFVTSKPGDNISVCTPFRLFPLKIRMRPFIRANMWIISIFIKRAMKKLGLSKPCLITCQIETAEMLPHFAEHVVCYDCIDDISAFEENPAYVSEQELFIAKKSQLVFATAKILYEKMLGINDNVYLVPNGVNVDMFVSIPSTTYSRPEDLPSTSPIIGYYGMLNPEWVDLELVFDTAKRNGNWTFVLIGILTKDIQTCPENVLLIEPKPFEQLPAYLKFFDVCMIPFKLNKLTEATNPVKLYEYLAAGKPVVSTKLPEIEQFHRFVSFANNQNEFESEISRSLMENSEDKIKGRQKIARENSWSQRCTVIKNQLNRLSEGENEGCS